MRTSILFAFAVCIAVAVAIPVSSRDERAVDALAAFAGLPEIQHGHAPAKDYIVIEILKPIIHYFAAEAHKEEAAVAANEEAEGQE